MGRMRTSATYSKVNFVRVELPDQIGREEIFQVCFWSIEVLIFAVFFFHPFLFCCGHE